MTSRTLQTSLKQTTKAAITINNTTTTPNNIKNLQHNNHQKHKKQLKATKSH
jgi:hypothetical protein